MHLIPEDTKKCAKCAEEKRLEEFVRDKRIKCGRGANCRACDRQRQGKWRDENVDRLRDYHKQWHEKNPEYRRNHSRGRRAENPDGIRAYLRQWYAQNLERARSHKKNNEHRRRSLAKGGMTSKELRDWESQQLKTCHWCGEKCAEDYQVDHRDPLSKGGKHEQRNLCISCPTCNMRKGSKDPIDFAQSLGMLV